MMAIMDASQFENASNVLKQSLQPILSQIFRISVVINDAVGPATAWILFEFKDGSMRSFLSSLEKRSVICWFEEFLPQLLARLKSCLSARSIEFAYITEIYQSDDCYW